MERDPLNELKAAQKYYKKTKHKKTNTQYLLYRNKERWNDLLLNELNQQIKSRLDSKKRFRITIDYDSEYARTLVTTFTDGETKNRKSNTHSEE